ncbi:hypothetical protein HYPSUDRAFT_44581 [Hypholoma sublateritium FD-334 SS-4]|uniref:Cytochrome P450 n=1 Tax=Hypholoma sublateritium (strain FD-334 SS-4) TaxID=945553 RepID=A0A0D2NJQ3_HYPSF|nr:hypothetical protein HYPSUDRAFT_44581 [Hypholoma sublateritium FD-334 SS-4]
MSSELSSITLASLVLVSLCVIISAIPWRSRRNLPYPPGPPSKNYLSKNTSDISVPYVWCRYSEWAKEYGSILYLRTFGQQIIILDSLEDATELLERRSKSYSSRPIVPMYDLMGLMQASVSMRLYGEEWRKLRRIFQQAFKSDSSLEYRPIQTKKMHDLMYGLLQTQEDLESHVHTYAAAIILSVIYGYNVALNGDPFVKLVESTLEAFVSAGSPQWSVNSLPFLRYIPSWMPGAGFKRYAESMRLEFVKQREVPFQYATTSPAALEGAHIPVVPKFINSCKSDMDIKILMEAAGSGYGAGVGTTASTIMVFLVAMVLYPDIQKKAQEEIDCITKGNRLPEYSDQIHLPYIQAIIREVIRWKPIVPLGLAHANNDDDIYKGYFIPKGSIIYANIWSMTRDPVKYKDPEAFDPERFLTETGDLNDDEVTYAFGFGRRICPGRHLGAASVWLAVATILASFNVEQKKDGSGHLIPVGVKFTDKGVTSSPHGLQCSIMPRSERAKQIILECRGEV